VETINARSMLDAAVAATADRPLERRRKLSQAALAVVDQKVRRAYSPIVIAGVVRGADFALLSVVGVALYLGYVVPLSGFHWEYIAAIFGMTTTAVLCFQAADIYEVQVFRGQLQQMTRMISSWAFVFLLFIGVSFFAKLGGEISRFWLSAFFCAGLAALIAERLFLRAMVRGWARDGRLDRRTIVVGSDESGEKLVEALEAQEDSDIDILGVFDDRNDDRALDTCAGRPKLGKVDDIVEFARRTRVDLVLFALPISAETRILEMLKKLWVLPVDIRLSAHTNKLRFRPRSYSYLGKVPTLDVFEAPITDWDLALKWLFGSVSVHSNWAYSFFGDFGPATFDYSISGEPATVHDLLIQKSDGTYVLAVWGDQIAGESANVTVNLGRTFSMVNVYDVTIGTSPIQSLSSISSVPLTLTDHAFFLEF